MQGVEIEFENNSAVPSAHIRIFRIYSRCAAMKPRLSEASLNRQSRGEVLYSGKSIPFLKQVTTEITILLLYRTKINASDVDRSDRIGISSGR